MMIEQILFHIIDGQQMAFEKKFYELSDIFRNAQGCEKFKLIRGIEDDQKYILQIHWIELKTQTELFMQTDEFKHWVTVMAFFLTSKIEIQYFENTLV